MQRQKASPYAPLIDAATGAPESRLAMLENLMRDHIFHSTLDWQSAEELADGARRAHDLYLSAPAYFEGLQNHQRAVFRATQLEAKLVRARKSGDPKKITELEALVRLAHEFVAAARAAIPRLETFYQLA